MACETRLRYKCKKGVKLNHHQIAFTAGDTVEFLKQDNYIIHLKGIKGFCKDEKIEVNTDEFLDSCEFDYSVSVVIK